MKITRFLNRKTVFSILAAACLSSTALAAEMIGTGTVEGDSLRMRSEASTSAPIVTYLDDKTQVQVYEDLGDWYKVAYEGHEGFVSADYLVYTPAAATVSNSPAAAGNIGIIIGEGVNFRTGPSTESGSITTLSRDAQITVAEVLEEGWCLAAYNGQNGYVKSDYVSVNGIPLANPTGVITGDCVNLRSVPSTEGAIITKLSSQTEVTLVSLSDGWYGILYNGMNGYVRADYIQSGSAPAAASSIGASVAETAMQYLGTPYAYGGASGKGFDCSGFTMYIFGLHGYTLPHSATSQWNSSGVYVEKSDLQPGDLVLFNDPARNAGKACSHVGIYIGDNQFIHSSSGRSGGVIISSLGENYYSSYYKGAKRVG